MKESKIENLEKNLEKGQLSNKADSGNTDY